jgi:hypothetical protein
LSRKALLKLGDLIKQNKTFLVGDKAREDVKMGQTLQNLAIFVDTRDEMKRQRFLPLGMTGHLRKPDSPDYWIDDKTYYKPLSSRNMSGLSDVPISFHYVKDSEFYLREFFFYHFHPFGLEKNLTETLPRKLTLKEIIEASDAKSESKLYKEHKHVHNMDSSELF